MTEKYGKIPALPLDKSRIRWYNNAIVKGIDGEEYSLFPEQERRRTVRVFGGILRKVAPELRMRTDKTK